MSSSLPEVLPKKDHGASSPVNEDFQAPRTGLQASFDKEIGQETSASAAAAEPLMKGSDISVSDVNVNSEGIDEGSSESIKESDKVVSAPKGKGRSSSGAGAKAGGSTTKAKAGAGAKGGKGAGRSVSGASKKGGKAAASTSKGGKKGGATASSITSKGKDSAQDVGSTEANGIGSGPFNSIFPLARISRIVKVDKEIEMTSKDAIWTIATATELFIKHLTDSAYAKARMDKKRTITYKELASAVESQNEFFFLQDAIPQPISLSKALEMRKAIETKNHLREAGLLEGDEEEEENQNAALDSLTLVNQSMREETMEDPTEADGKGAVETGVVDEMLLDDDDDEDLPPALPNGIGHTNGIRSSP